MERLFTLEEANALLPRLREILLELRQTVGALERSEAEVGQLRRKLRGNGHNVPEEPFERLEAAREAAQRLIGQLQELGCELKDPRQGLIDFPSRRAGETVYLCWKLDEPTIAYWHPLDTGFAGRRPL
jgi:hypothetical protein